MRAVRVQGWGRPPVVEELSEPVCGVGETVVALDAATVGHLDRTIWSGAFLRPPGLPYTPGIEGAGRVVASDRFPSGQRVWVRGGGLGVARDGTWAERAVVPDAALGPLPDGVPMAVGAAFFSPCTSAWVALHSIAAVRPDDRVLVTGAGGAVGSVAVQLAGEAGAEVAALVADATRYAADGVAVLTELSDEVEPFDVIVDTVGGPVLQACLDHVASGARVVAVGYLAGHELRLDLPAFVQRNASLLPLNMIAREAEGRAAVPALLERLADGRLTVETTEFGLDDVASALAWLVERGHRGRAVLRVDGETEAEHIDLGSALRSSPER